MDSEAASRIPEYRRGCNRRTAYIITLPERVSSLTQEPFQETGTMNMKGKKLMEELIPSNNGGIIVAEIPTQERLIILESTGLDASDAEEQRTLALETRHLNVYYGDFLAGTDTKTGMRAKN